jgi:predicted nuclease of restriction endonuclease-like (RecB) superfamily
VIFINYYDEIKNKLIDNEIYNRVKDYSKERNKVITYFEVGKLLDEAGKNYGENIIKEYSLKLINEVGKKFNERTLRRIRQYYRVFCNKKWSPLATKLSWSHYTELLSIKDERKLNYYINISIKNNLSKRQLREKIKTNEYERLDEETKSKLINNEEYYVTDFVKNPILIKNNFNYKEISEKVLKKLILENIESFMNELGNSFCFVGSEYKIKIGNRYNYIDLLLFNIEYNCYVVIELKVTELKKEHVGQIQVYMNYIDNNLKKLSQDSTIGIIICKKNNYIIEYCSDDRIIAREYSLV